MIVETLSTFPGMFASVMGASIMKRAQEKGILEFAAHDLRDWTHDRHRTTDDYPFGGGQGLVMKPEPIFEAHDALVARPGYEHPHVVFLAPVGTPFTSATVASLAEKMHLLFVCGHYEGIDERCYTLADEVISLGDYVLSSGELAAMVVIDAVVRTLPGVLGDEGSAVDESFYDGLLEYPQYTRPASYRGIDVPEVLLSGDHAAVDAWRRQRSIERTLEVRPDLLQCANLADEERIYVERLLAQRGQ